MLSRLHFDSQKHSLCCHRMCTEEHSMLIKFIGGFHFIASLPSFIFTREWKKYIRMETDLQQFYTFLLFTILHHPIPDVSSAFFAFLVNLHIDPFFLTHTIWKEKQKITQKNIFLLISHHNLCKTQTLTDEDENSLRIHSTKKYENIIVFFYISRNKNTLLTFVFYFY